MKTPPTPEAATPPSSPDSLTLSPETAGEELADVQVGDEVTFTQLTVTCTANGPEGFSGTPTGDVTIETPEESEPAAEAAKESPAEPDDRREMMMKGMMGPEGQ